MHGDGQTPQTDPAFATQLPAEQAPRYLVQSARRQTQLPQLLPSGAVQACDSVTGVPPTHEPALHT